MNWDSWSWPTSISWNATSGLAAAHAQKWVHTPWYMVILVRNVSYQTTYLVQFTPGIVSGLVHPSYKQDAGVMTCYDPLTGLKNSLIQYIGKRCTHIKYGWQRLDLLRRWNPISTSVAMSHTNWVSPLGGCKTATICQSHMFCLDNLRSKSSASKSCVKSHSNDACIYTEWDCEW